MFEEITEKIVKAHNVYKELNRKYGILMQAYNDLKIEHKDDKDYIDFLKFDIASQQKKRKKLINEALKLLKTENPSIKEIRKILNEVKKVV